MRERALQQQLNAKSDAQLKLLNGPHPETQAVAIETEINALTIKSQQTQTQIRQSSPRYAALRRPQPLTLAEIRRQEAEQILPLAPASAGMNALDFEANRATAMSERLSQRRSMASARRRRCARRR
jgi:hypothetical protein